MRSRLCQLTGRRRKWAVALLSTVILVGSGVVAWRHFHPPATPIVLPPEIPSTVHDPEIIAVLEWARNSVISEPRSGQAWGDLGLVFRAHRFNDQSNVCFAEASRLDPSNPRWPYLIGLHLMLSGSESCIPYLK